MHNDASVNANQVVFTNKAGCRDCYRCLRACPVKAIRMQNGQAFVVEARCIACGTCIRECPQGAKVYRNNVVTAARLLKSGAVVAASIAPSFAAVFDEWERKRLPSALRQLGCAYIGETATGAHAVAKETARIAAERPGGCIASACPAVVSYVEHYVPDLAHRLAPVVSPMLAHARQIRHALAGKDVRVLFIGPCVAKKAEAERPGNEGLVDCVLTFEELAQLFEREGVSLKGCEESAFDDAPHGAARYFPVPGGLMRTASMQAGLLEEDCLAVSGIVEMLDAVDTLRGEHPFSLVEPMFCTQGCVTGPGMPSDRNAYSRRNCVISHARKELSAQRQTPPDPPELSAVYAANPCMENVFTEQEVAMALEEAGKLNREDQLNCGACGYTTCREKAIACLAGMAEAEMCVPRMRRLAEQRTDRIIATSPNGILILDEHLAILGMNTAFKQLFVCSDAVLGRPVSYLMDPASFEKLAAGETEMIDMIIRHDAYNLVCHEKLYPLREERQYVGIFVNITKSQQDEQHLKRLRSDTVRQARELLEHQIQTAQEMAQYLGETTARGEALVRNLMRVVVEKDDEDDAAERKGGPQWPTRTLK